MLSLKRESRKLCGFICEMKKSELVASSAATKRCRKTFVICFQNNFHFSEVSKFQTRHLEKMSVAANYPVLASSFREH